jgi:hypothetical protein
MDYPAASQLLHVRGRTEPDFPGGLSANHSLQGTPELAYGITDWCEIGFYAPFAVAGGQLLSNGAKVRNLFVVPNAEKRDFFYGINFEFSYQTPPFSLSRYALEIRPIIGVRNKDWEFVVNPIVDISFGGSGQADFAPALRVARNLGEDRLIGIEYYGDFGRNGNFLPLQRTKPSAVCRGRLQGRKVRCRAWTWLRADPGIGWAHC